MAFLTKLLNALLHSLRLMECLLAFLTLGTTAYCISQYRSHTSMAPPSALVLPLVTAIFNILITPTVAYLRLREVALGLDGVFTVLYISCAAHLHGNIRIGGGSATEKDRGWLWRDLVVMRLMRDQDARMTRSEGIVKGLGAGVVGSVLVCAAAFGVGVWVWRRQQGEGLAKAQARREEGGKLKEMVKGVRARYGV